MGNLSVEQRNSLVEQYLWCIDRVMGQNGSLIRAAHLDKAHCSRRHLDQHWYRGKRGFENGDGSFRRRGSDPSAAGMAGKLDYRLPPFDGQTIASATLLFTSKASRIRQ